MYNPNEKCMGTETFKLVPSPLALCYMKNEWEQKHSN